MISGVREQLGSYVHLPSFVQPLKQRNKYETSI